MSDKTTFIGKLQYPNEMTALLALQKFSDYECIDESLVQNDDLHLNVSVIEVCFEEYGSYDWWEISCGAILEMATLAIAGHVDAELDVGEGEESIYRLRLLAGGEELRIDGPFPIS
jgi:hypothetical protein